jgi:hypothetical protein
MIRLASARVVVLGTETTLVVMISDIIISTPFTITSFAALTR